MVSSIYNPLGFGAPIIQPTKVMLQQLCKLKLNWDNPHSLALKGKWVRSLQQIPLLSGFQFPRCYKLTSFEVIVESQLHHLRRGLRICNVFAIRKYREEIPLLFGFWKTVTCSFKRVNNNSSLIDRCNDFRIFRKFDQELQIDSLKQSGFWTDRMSSAIFK